MSKMILRWVAGVVSALAMVQILKYFDMSISWPDKWHLVLFVPVLAIANAVIGGILRLMSMPITCLTLGLFGFVINAIVFWIAGDITGAKMGFIPALAGSVVYTLLSSILSSFIKEKRRD